MLKYLTNLWVARALIIMGFLLGLRSVGYTALHIGSELFLLTPESRLVQTPKGQTKGCRLPSGPGVLPVTEC